MKMNSTNSIGRNYRGERFANDNYSQVQANRRLLASNCHRMAQNHCGLQYRTGKRHFGILHLELFPISYH